MTMVRAGEVLAFGTVLGADFTTLVRAARAAGAGQFTVSPGTYLDALSEADLSVALIDPLISPLTALPDISNLPAHMRRWFTATQDEAFDAATALRAEWVTVVHPWGGTIPWAQLVDLIGAVAADAANRGLGIAIEFVPAGAIPSFRAATAIVDELGAANVGVVFDLWHFFHSGGELAEIGASRPGLIKSLQVSDAPARSITAGAPRRLSSRLLPGDGALPIASWVAAVLERNPGLAVTTEVMNPELQALPPEEAARRAVAATRRVLRAAP